MNLIYEQKPTILLLVDDKMPKQIAEFICYGIEEEEIPFEVQTIQTTDTALSLARQASELSNLLVGIGIADKKIILHYRLLQKDHFLYQLDVSQIFDKSALKIIGCNAARMVKGQPFVSCAALTTSF